MKKLLLGSAALLMFSCAIVVFQMSCKKDANAQTTGGTSNKILYLKRPIGNFEPEFETWIANYDGSNATQIFITVPGWRINGLKLSPDGNKIFFTGTDSASISAPPYKFEIFSANVDGSNVQQISHDNSAGKSTDLWDVQ